MRSDARATAQLMLTVCETPKSPPGDYNLTNGVTANTCPHWSCVKHLNPRQGITTRLLSVNMT